MIGTVALGEGDDTLTLIGTAQVHDGGGTVFDLPGGNGTDTLVLQGTGAIASIPVGFEIGIKTGGGTFFLPSLATLDRLELDEGVLSLGADYVFSAAGDFSTYVHSEGDRGMLSVAGSVAAAGAIEVERRGDTYISDGTRWTVVDASAGVTGGFADVTLPESRPLLGFALEQDANTVDVVANAESFASVTGHRLYREVGANLDGIAGGATGDFARQLGTIQGMASGFDRAYASLAPDSYEVLTTNTVVVGHETAQLLRQHLSNAGDVRRGDRSPYAAYQPAQLAYAGGDLRVVNAGMWPALMTQEGPAASGTAVAKRGRAPKAQTWTSAFYSTGDYDFDEGFTEYDYDSRGFVIGADYLLGERTIAGFMASYADTGADEVHAVASADVESWTGGLYASSYWGGTYVEGGVLYSSQSFDNRRTLLIGTEERTAVSDHDGSALLLFAGAGREFDVGSWRVEPYATLYWFDIDEDAFEEEGADSLNLLFGSKSAEVLLGEAGARFVRLQQVRNGAIDWHAALAYNHDFDIGEGTIAYAYQGEPGSLLLVTDRNVAAGSAVLGAGVAWVRHRSTLAVDYRGQFNSGYRNHIVGLRLSLAF